MPKSAAVASESILAVPKMTEAELAAEVEPLLKLVDPRVLHRRVPVAAANNAWPLWDQAGKLLTKLPDDDEFQEGLEAFLDGKPISDSLLTPISDWAKTNEQCSQLIDQGNARGQLELPRAAKTIRLSLAMDEISLLRSLARLKAINARLRLNQRDVAGAITDASSILKFGTILLQSECLLVDYLVAQAILGVGALHAYQAAMSPLASDDQAKSVIGKLAKAKSMTDDVKRAYRVEVSRWFLPYVAGFPKQADHQLLARYYVAADIDADYQPSSQQLDDYARAMRQIAVLLDGHPRPFDKPATIRLLSDLHVKLFNQFDKPSAGNDDDLFAALNEELSPWPGQVDPDTWIAIGIPNPEPLPALTDYDLQEARDALRTVDNVLGKRLVAQLMSAVNLGTQRIQQARLEAARIRIALRLYQKRHGKLPVALNDLQIDGFLSEVPVDPFDGQAFKYSAERRLIWCFGHEDEPDGEPGVEYEEEGVHLRWRIAG